MTTPKRSRDESPTAHRRLGRRTALTWLPIAIAVSVLLYFVTRPESATPSAWTTLGTADAHALTFVGEDPARLLFGHHGGLLASEDGGLSWTQLAASDDAMSVSVATDDSIIIAGHEVLAVSRDAGATWADLDADLPSRDIHGFARDPADPGRMWAALASGGLWASADGGLSWSQVRSDNVLSPVAIRAGGQTRLLGVDASGLVASDDAGRTWSALTTPPTYPLTALAAEGETVFAGSMNGLHRSDDAGRTWTPTAYTSSVLGLAVTGNTVAVVDRRTNFFRSDDGGASWPAPG